MKVGYIGNLFLTGENKKFNDMVYFLSEEAKTRELAILILTGGISYNYEVTLNFVDRLGKILKESGIKLRFITGNTDFYYTKYASVVDKEEKFRETLRRYNISEYYLPTHPIFTKSTRITGIETWYDYTLYRGRPKSLKDITKKSILLLRNRDNDFITDKSDYTLGVNDTFDKRYTQETYTEMKRKLEANENKYTRVSYNVVVQYFSPSKTLLKNGLIENYFGTFCGSLRYMELLKLFRVNQCIIGTSCKERTLILNGIKFFNPESKKILEVEYYEN